MTNQNNLFSEFSSASAEQWIQQIVKDLKGENYEQKLVYTNYDGIAVKPFYAKEDLQNYTSLEPLFSHSDWDICQEIEVENEINANKKALHALNNGASALLFYVFNSVDLTKLLNDIQIEYIAVQFVIEEDATDFQNNFTNYLKSKNIPESSINVTLNIDPIENLIRTGQWRKLINEDKTELVSLIKNKANAFCINANIYHNAGASESYEIACVLAHANTYINWLIEDGIDIKETLKTIQLNIAVGPNYFFEIAKLRAYRKAFALLFNEYNLNIDLKIHAETAFRNLSVADAYNNLLRTTTEAMAASIGGCNSLVVKPFNITYESPTDFSERLARNIQLILKSESYFDKIADVSAGSYFIEELTEQIAKKAWTYFTEIESNGGVIKCLEKGVIQSKISEMALAQQALFDEAKTVLVGTNKFPNTKETIKQFENTIAWGSSSKLGKVIEPLTTIRLAAKAEHERIEQEKIIKE